MLYSSLCAKLLRTEKAGRFAIRSVRALQEKITTLCSLPAAAKKQVRATRLIYHIKRGGSMATVED